MVHAVRSCPWLSVFGRNGVGSANIGPLSWIHSFTAISHYLTPPTTHKLPAIVTTSYHFCVNRAHSHHVYWEPKMQAENSHHVYWEPKKQTENSRCIHTWHRGDAREKSLVSKIILTKLKMRPATQMQHSLQYNSYSNISTRAMQDFRKCHRRGYCWRCGTSRTSWTSRKIRQLSYNPTHTDPLQTIRWLIHR